MIPYRRNRNATLLTSALIALVALGGALPQAIAHPAAETAVDVGLHALCPRDGASSIPCANLHGRYGAGDVNACDKQYVERSAGPHVARETEILHVNGLCGERSPANYSRAVAAWTPTPGEAVPLAVAAFCASDDRQPPCEAWRGDYGWGALRPCADARVAPVPEAVCRGPTRERVAAETSAHLP